MNLRNRKLLFNTSSSLVYQVTTIVCGFILPRIILNAYGSEVNGLVNSITQFLGIISFLELGVGSVIQSSLYKSLAEKDLETMSKVLVSGQRFFSKLGIILLVYVVGLMIIYPIVVKSELGIIYTVSMIGVISISLFGQYFFGIINRLLLISDQRGYVSYNIHTISLIINTATCFVLIKCGASIHIVKLVTSIIYIFRPIYLSIYVRRNYNINWKIKYEIEPIQQKWNGVAQHVASVVLDGTDTIVLTIFAGLKAVSIYSVYNMVTLGVKQILLSMTSGVQAIIGELWAKQEIEELKKYFGWVEWCINTVSIFVFGMTYALILQFVQVYTYGVFDINYIQPTFAILIILANAGHCLRLPYNIMILAAGHYKQTQGNYIIATAINIVISIITVRCWGLIGVAIGTIIAMFYQTIWMAWYNSKNLICWPLKYFIKQIITDAICICIFFVVSKLSFLSFLFEISKNSYMVLIIHAVGISIFYFLVVCLVNLIFYRDNVFKLIFIFVKKLKKSR